MVLALVTKVSWKIKSNRRKQQRKKLPTMVPISISEIEGTASIGIKIELECSCNK